MKKMLRKIPILKQLFRKFDIIGTILAQQQEVINSLQNSYEHIKNTLQSTQEEIEKQKKKNMTRINALKKSLNIPIKVVFLIEEPSVIKNMLRVIEEIENDDRFELVLVNLWYRGLADKSFKRPNIEGVIDVSKYRVIESYDKETDCWFSLESLFPDYVFFSRPYDHYRIESYQIHAIAEYAKACYVPYCMQVIGGEVERLMITPECAGLYYYFVDNATRVEYVRECVRGTYLHDEGKILYLGYPGLDMLRQHEEITELKSELFTVLWLPRWRTVENNCHFFDYKDELINYANTSGCKVILRPHSLCFENFLNTGELTVKSLAMLREQYSSPHEIDEKGNYIDAFAKSSVLVADETSLIAEYFLTGKPIVFCKKESHYSSLMLRLIAGCYVVETKEDLISVLQQLQNGQDVLKEIRLQIAKDILLDYGLSAASNIKEELWKDFNDSYL